LGLPFAVHDPNTIGIRQRPTRRREPISPGRGIVRLSLIAIVLLLIATSFQAIAVPSKDELLSDSEITSLGTLSRLAGATQTLWSDDRLASGFLYFEGTRFVTFDVKYNSSEAAKAALALFYEGSCKAGIQYLHDTGATIAVVSLYMADVGVVLRTGRFNPATKVESCLDASGSRFFDSGSVIAYSFDTSP